MCARVSPSTEARRGATLRSLWSHVSALLCRESDNVYAAPEKARIRVRLRRNTVAQFARLRHGRLVNSAGRNQTPRTPSTRSCIPISPVASTTPRAISLLEIAGWRIRARRFSRDSSLQFLSFASPITLNVPVDARFTRVEIMIVLFLG